MKILIYGDYGCISGFSKVINKLVEGFRKELPSFTEIDVMALNYYGKETTKGNLTFFSAYEAQKRIKGDEKDTYGRLAFLDRINKVWYDKILVINDLQVIAPLYNFLSLIKDKNLKSHDLRQEYIFYFPVDSEITRSEIVNPMIKNCDINVFDTLITYCHFGKGNLNKALKSFLPSKYFEMQDKIKIIPHGIEKPKEFITEEEREKIRTEYFHVSKGDFLIGQINRNCVRKDYPGSLLAYKYFLDLKRLDGEDTRKYKYYIHASPTDPFGFDLFSILANLDIDPQNVIITPPDFNENKGSETVEKMGMHKIYQCLDLFLTTTMAEGWGLTPCEAVANRVPVIAPSHTSFKEIFFDNKIFQTVFPLKNITETFINDLSNRKRYKCDFVETAYVLDATIKRIRSMPSQHETDLKEASDKIINQMNWENIIKEWLPYIKESRLISLRKNILN
ncbi:MAG: glycosyltransferase [Chitinophagaceae bacterium]